METSVRFARKAVERLLRVMTADGQFDHVRVEASSDRSYVHRMVEGWRNFRQDHLSILEFSYSWQSKGLRHDQSLCFATKEFVLMCVCCLDEEVECIFWRFRVMVKNCVTP